MKKNFLLRVVCEATLFALVFTLFLNIVLQQPHLQALNVIRQNTTPALWLTYWATLLAAVATFVMAWISYYQNNKQYQTEVVKSEISRLERQYDELEKFIVEVESVHSWEQIEIIMELINKKNNNKVEIRQLIFSLYIRAKKISNLIIRYREYFNDEYFHKYGDTVAWTNNHLMDILVHINDYLGNDNQTQKYKELCDVIKAIQNQYIECGQEMMKKGFELLNQQRIVINNLRKSQYNDNQYNEKNINSKA